MDTINEIQEEIPTVVTKQHIQKDAEEETHEHAPRRKPPTVFPRIEEERIKIGDLVVAYFDPQNQLLFEAKLEGTLDGKFGHFKHREIVGQKYASKVWSMDEKNYMFVLKPNKTKFTDTMLQRTQILYHMDIASIINFLDIQPGKKVVESGTGSGSLSLAFSKHLGTTGHLFTFEFNKERYEKAEEELAKLDVKNASFFNRNAYLDGFLVDGKLGIGEADAVFLDLPSPWNAVEHASKVLSRGGRICNFSPCIEQVQKTIQALSLEGFGDFRTIEALQRHFMKKAAKDNSIYATINKKLEEETGKVDEDQDQVLRLEFSNGAGQGKWHTGYLTFATKFR